MSDHVKALESVISDLSDYLESDNEEVERLRGILAGMGACETPAGLPARDRSRETTGALTEVRTVLSRAETAISGVRHWEAYAERDWPPHGWAPDPDAVEMYRALHEVVRLLSPWRRRGR